MYGSYKQYQDSSETYGGEVDQGSEYVEDPVNDDWVADAPWYESTRIYEENFPVTSMHYDPKHEMLWTGHQNGRISSHLFDNKSEYITSDIYSSFMANDAAIVNVTAIEGSIVSVSHNSAQLHSKGGMLIGTFAKASQLPDLPVQVLFLETLFFFIITFLSALILY